LTYTRFDTYSLLLNNADLASEMFARTLHLLEGCGRLPRIHATSWQVGDVDKALHAVAEMPCYGSALVQCNSSNHQLVKVVKEKQVKSLRSIIHNEGTYLIVGGFLGLGRSIAELLIDHGARDFAFISRSGATTKASKAAMSNLQSKGANISALTVDILNETALNTAITHVQQSMPTIRGVFQCAAVIQDAIFDNMTFAEWNAAVLPKTIGSWNLVESISAAGMNPFYVFLASSAGVIGNRGQANYAAGNSFEDAMAHSLRLQGKHAVSIDLGPVLGAGMLAEDEETLDMLRASGFHSISHEDFLRVISHAITGEILEGQPMPPQVVLGVGTGAIIRQNQPADPYWTRTALYSYLDLIDMPPPDLSAATSIASMGIRAALARAPSTTAAGKIVAVGIREMLAKAMTMLPEEIDMDKPPNAYGVDSLVAIGLRNWVQGSCGVEISLFEVLSDQSVGDMGTMIAKRGGYGGGGDD
jgi:NAD(P)-dependent dehydrogenase (short-subunit alcohol dehydrogenase family)